MRLSVLGVGLIGGSIGLAARKSLDAQVFGYDPDRTTADRALELGALDSAAPSVSDACAGADIVFCAAPVGALPDLAAQALEATADDAVVTDVGSVKRGLIAAVGDNERFIGGHPLSGAETSGVENARADLFEGARWYLTPTERSTGTLYDRLQRTIADLGARPQAIDPEAHDQIMASVSHLPHVLANVLAARAAESLQDQGDRVPDVGPSFRDTARVAGANPAIWTDIFLSNRDAVAAEADALAKRLHEAADLLREGDETGIAAWHREALDKRRALLETEVTGGPLSEIRITVPHRPGVVSELAVELGNAGVNIEDMALHPAPDGGIGGISIWVAGEEESERAADVVRGLDYGVTVLRGEG